ncbi:MAG: TonB-dependent receptor domain-containing protein [Wenzhouxiangella sp.]
MNGKPLFASLLLLAFAAAAQDPEREEEGEDNRTVDTITVVAHRQPRRISEVAGTVTVIGQDRMDRDMVVDMADLVRYEPGVEVDQTSTRFGFGGFRIRGIGGNRTAVVIDNVPAPDRFSVGNFADTGRGLMELGLADRVEILRGPASTLYGSKALGGVVAVSLLDVDDVANGEDYGTRVNLAGHTDADRVRATSATAMRNDDFSLLIAAAGQDSGEVDVADRPDSTPLDRIDRRQGGVLLRGAMETGRGRVRLTFDGLRETRDSDIRAMLGQGRFANTTDLQGDDRRSQWRVLLDHHFEGAGIIDRGNWRAWHQVADTRQETDEQRPLAPTPIDLFRRFEFRQETSGVGADLESGMGLFDLSHRIGYGFELSRSNLTTRRDALQIHRETGESTNVVLGEVFPLRDFPESRVTEFGLYVHDEIRLWGGGPTISPGLRFEYYDMSVGRDRLFEASFPDAETTDLDTTSWMPKFGVLWPIGENTELFGQYARGFRAPPFEDVNIGLEIPMFNIRAIANPDLEPERGRTIEAGWRWHTPGTLAELVVFRNDYKDFIETRAPLGFDPASGFLLFQSINRDRVRIEGGELRLRQRLGAGFATELAAEWTRGEDQADGRSLAEISPPRAIAELAWTSPSARWETRLIASAVKAQRSLVDEQGEALFSPPGHLTLDLLGRWFPRQDLEIGLGLFNLTDRQYWRAANVIGRAGDDPTLPLLAEPGRSVMASLTWRR